ncbi:PHD and RING finger domain-containing protein 1-like [Sitophilus oryzae]|uniref:PHD and RING finger domain-containing protein 1-like n=1 Tax=Sitophilus oryzae TaxID=7048 RepID=A0A6J2YQE1_SITOR|nr:PHD and RING finger domain-containing protein 1-like [Sitophilus oryzae]
MNAINGKRKRDASANFSESDSEEGENLENKKLARLVAEVSNYKGEPELEQPTTSSHTENSSDSDTENTNKCPVCLKALHNQVLAVPDTCSHHIFCLSCLEEWTKIKTTCPVDRKEYFSILVLNSEGVVSNQIPIKAPRNQGWTLFNPFTVTNQPSYCEVCGSYHDEERMLLCGGCEMSFHVYCLNPPLDHMPVGMWLCSACWNYYNY